MRIQRLLMSYMEIYEKGVQITIPSFIILFSPQKFLYFTGFLRYRISVECHTECHGMKSGIKFYTTFNASL